MFLGKPEASLETDFASNWWIELLCLLVGFIADQNEVQTAGAISLRLIQPPGNMIETLSTRDIVADHSSDRVSIVPPSDRFEWLLACGVPNLQLYRVIVQ